MGACSCVCGYACGSMFRVLHVCVCVCAGAVAMRQKAAHLTVIMFS